MISTSQELKQLCKGLSSQNFITIDTEFLREKTYYPKLCLVQLSDPDKNAVTIDPLAKGIDLKPLYELLANENVLKVFHAGRQDLEIFYIQGDVVPQPFFDTQIAAMVCGFGDSVGYEKIVRDVTGVQIDKSSQFTDWSLRPLSNKQLSYALGDVTHLVDVYHHLANELEKKNRTSWLLQEEEILSDPATYVNDPYEVWKKVKLRSPNAKTLIVLKELAAWREQQARRKNIPKNWIMKDETLAAIAQAAPNNKDKLSSIRNISKDMASSHTGETIIGLVKTALDTPKEHWPQAPERKKQLSSSASATLDILKMLLKIQSAEHGVAAKLIASSDDLELIARGETKNLPALRGWRYDVFGKDALDLKAGKIAIGLNKGQITKIRIKNGQES
ncbi:MAG: ribonuclease D [Alphaproteobacteria bacterium]|nr:ribonuclease D [Alphaproteobacteria bacterium]